jgi:hypothetical protein
MHDAISEVTQDLPRLQRQMFYRGLYDRIGRMIDAGETIMPGDVPAILAEIRQTPKRNMATH